MAEVVCWCCEHFAPRCEIYEGKEVIKSGVCGIKMIDISTENRVCEDFLLRSGLFTQRSIPSYCKNYKDSFI